MCGPKKMLHDLDWAQYPSLTETENPVKIICLGPRVRNGQTNSQTIGESATALQYNVNIVYNVKIVTRPLYTL